LTVQQKEAEARKAIADAEKLELAAKLPTTETKLLGGSINSEKFGAASLVKAFDLAKDLAHEVCESVPSNTGFVIYDTATIQGIVSARAVEREIGQLSEQLTSSNEQLGTVLKGEAKALWAAPLLGVGAAVTGIKAAADLASVFKSNLTVVGTSYGDGSKSLFTTTLAEQCLTNVKGLSNGYFGELDDSRYATLREKYTDLVKQRAGFATSIDQVKKILDDKNTVAARKEELTPLYAGASQLLKAADIFIESLKASEVSDKSPLFNAARYLAYEKRTSGADILDLELRLEGLSITKENIFIGQRLRLSGVAFLTYRVYDPQGNIGVANPTRIKSDTCVRQAEHSELTAGLS